MRRPKSIWGKIPVSRIATPIFSPKYPRLYAASALIIFLTLSIKLHLSFFLLYAENLFLDNRRVKPMLHPLPVIIYFSSFGTSFMEKLILPILSLPIHTTFTLSPSVNTSSTRLIRCLEILEM